MAVIRDEEESSTVGQIDLHANQTICMSRQMMQRDALTEVNGPVVKSLPVPAVMLAQIIYHHCLSTHKSKSR
jgi:hypothetical protein